MNAGFDPAQFAAAWIAAWNKRDLESVLAHYSETIVFRSPRIAAVTGDTSGVVRGLEALRAYWRKALDLAPSLHFELERVYAGANTVTLTYRNQRGQHAAETMVFDGRGLITEGIAAYG